MDFNNLEDNVLLRQTLTTLDEISQNEYQEFLRWHWTVVDDIGASALFVGLIESTADEIWIGLDCWTTAEAEMLPTDEDWTGTDCWTRTEDDMPLSRIGVETAREEEPPSMHFGSKWNKTTTDELWNGESRYSLLYCVGWLFCIKPSSLFLWLRGGGRRESVLLCPSKQTERAEQSTHQNTFLSPSRPPGRREHIISNRGFRAINFERFNLIWGKFPFLIFSEIKNRSKNWRMFVITGGSIANINHHLHVRCRTVSSIVIGKWIYDTVWGRCGVQDKKIYMSWVILECIYSQCILQR